MSTDDTPRDPLAAETAMEALLDLLPGSLSEDRDIRRAADAVLDATRPSGDEALRDAFDAVEYAVSKLPPSGGRMSQAAERRMAEALDVLRVALATPSSAPVSVKGIHYEEAE